MHRELLDDLERLIETAESQRRDADRMIAALNNLRNQLAHTTLPLVESKTHYESIVDFFVANGNVARSVGAIASATGLPLASLSQVIYKTHRDQFARDAPPGHVRKKLWRLNDDVFREVGGPAKGTLFEAEEKDMAGMSAKECCYQILSENGNQPTNALTLAREALKRGYVGGTEGSEDDRLMTTAKSFWARLCRDSRFFEIRPQVFILKAVASMFLEEGLTDDEKEKLDEVQDLFAAAFGAAGLAIRMCRATNEPEPMGRMIHFIEGLSGQPRVSIPAREFLAMPKDNLVTLLMGHLGVA